MKAVLAALLLVGSLSTASANGRFNHCEKYLGKTSGNGAIAMPDLLQQLAAKLGYSYEELCQHPRIMDIYSEVRNLHNREKDTFELHQFITLHYNEYSCEYRFNLVTNSWGAQKCYNTF